MRRFSGLRRVMPVTHWTFLVGCLALAGVSPFAGFWSKDGILATVYEQIDRSGTDNVLGIAGLTTGKFYLGLFWVGMFTALLTAFYTFRAFFMTFFGPEKIPDEAGHHAHESPPTMTLPLVILAACAAVVGFLLLDRFSTFIAKAPSLAWPSVPNPQFEEAEQERIHDFVAVTSSVLALAGIGVAAFLYLGDRRQAAWLARVLRPAYWLSHGKFFIDQIYDGLVIRPLSALSSLCNWFDRWIVDGLVNLIGGDSAAGRRRAPVAAEWRRPVLRPGDGPRIARPDRRPGRLARKVNPQCLPSYSSRSSSRSSAWRSSRRLRRWGRRRCGKARW